VLRERKTLLLILKKKGRWVSGLASFCRKGSTDSGLPRDYGPFLGRGGGSGPHWQNTLFQSREKGRKLRENANAAWEKLGGEKKEGGENPTFFDGCTTATKEKKKAERFPICLAGRKKGDKPETVWSEKNGLKRKFPIRQYQGEREALYGGGRREELGT